MLIKKILALTSCVVLTAVAAPFDSSPPVKRDYDRLTLGGSSNYYVGGP
jgi:hypothetical protein